MLRIRFGLIISTCEDAIGQCGEYFKSLPSWFKLSIPTKPKRTGRGCVSGSCGARKRSRR